MAKPIVEPHLAAMGINNPVQFLTQMLKTMTYDEMAEHLGLNASSLHNYCNRHDIRNVRPMTYAPKKPSGAWLKKKTKEYMDEKNGENKVIFFKCSRCEKSKNIILMSKVPDICTLCKKHMAMERV